MVQFEGKYKLESNTNFVELFEALGAPEEVLKKVGNPGPTTEIIKESEDTYSIQTEIRKVTITFGKEFKHPFGPFFVVGTSERDGNKVTVISALESEATKKVVRVYEFTDDGYTLTAEFGDIKAVRVYSRV